MALPVMQSVSRAQPEFMRHIDLFAEAAIFEIACDLGVVLEPIVRPTDPTVQVAQLQLQARLAALDRYILLLGEWEVVRMSLHASVDIQVDI